MDTLGSRLKYIREEKLQLKQYELAALLDVGKDSLGRYERDDMMPSGKTLTTMYEQTGVNPVWILTGEGEIFAESFLKDSKMARIPLVEAVLSAGGGSFETSEKEKYYFVLRRDFLASKGSIADMVLMQVTGDSMDPEIKDGDTVLIDQSQTRLVALGIYAVALQGLIYLKQINALPDKILLESINKEYAPVVIEPHDAGSLRILGRAIWWYREAV